MHSPELISNARFTSISTFLQIPGSCVLGVYVLQSIMFSAKKSMCRDEMDLPTCALILWLGDLRFQEITWFTWGHTVAGTGQKPVCHTANLQQKWFSLLHRSRCHSWPPTLSILLKLERRRGLGGTRRQLKVSFFLNFLTLIWHCWDWQSFFQSNYRHLKLTKTQVFTQAFDKIQNVFVSV